MFGKRTQLVVAILRASAGPMTDREVMVRAGFTDPNAVRPRITELVDAKIAMECKESVTCPVTKKTVRLVKLVPRAVQTEFDITRAITPEVVATLNERRTA